MKINFECSMANGNLVSGVKNIKCKYIKWMKVSCACYCNNITVAVEGVEVWFIDGCWVEAVSESGVSLWGSIAFSIFHLPDLSLLSVTPWCRLKSIISSCVFLMLGDKLLSAHHTVSLCTSSIGSLTFEMSPTNNIEFVGWVEELVHIFVVLQCLGSGLRNCELPASLSVSSPWGCPWSTGTVGC